MKSAFRSLDCRSRSSAATETESVLSVSAGRSSRWYPSVLPLQCCSRAEKMLFIPPIGMNWMTQSSNPFRLINMNCFHCSFCIKSPGFSFKPSEPSPIPILSSINCASLPLSSLRCCCWHFFFRLCRRCHLFFNSKIKKITIIFVVRRRHLSSCAVPLIFSSCVGACCLVVFHYHNLIFGKFVFIKIFWYPQIASSAVSHFTQSRC